MYECISLTKWHSSSKFRIKKCQSEVNRLTSLSVITQMRALLIFIIKVLIKLNSNRLFILQFQQEPLSGRCDALWDDC